MKILFIAPNYHNLHLPIIDEIIKQGHNITFFEDKVLKGDYSFKNDNFIIRLVKRILSFIFNYQLKYWKTIISNDIRFNQSYDILFFIQGQSFSPFLQKHLKNINPNLKSYLYVWDSNKFYNYFRNAQYFDKIYTFDWEDAKLFPNTSFLPFYWNDVDKNFNCIKYDLSIIGSDHDGRLSIIRKLSKQIEDYKLSTFIKIHRDNQNIKNSKLTKVIQFLNHKSNSTVDFDETDMEKFIIKETIPVDTVNRIILESNCILDTDRECQTGTTPRVIWALALGKKIVSTNLNLKNIEMRFIIL